MLEKISVIIIHHNRHKHLHNTLKGLESGTVLPDEVVVVDIDKNTIDLSTYKLNIVIKAITNFDKKFLPIGHARNLGAKTASFNHLVFLDVDCIPSKDFIKNVRNYLPFNKGLYMATPKYLTSKKIKDLENNSVYHPHRPKVKEITLWKDYAIFWSLVFFTHKKIFKAIGGFDDAYIGYGAEDTDFAFKAEAREIPFFITPEVVYHQMHPICQPPLNHLEAIVNNSITFFNKWNKWPMENHLQSFCELDYIDWKKKEKSIKIKKKPNEAVILNTIVVDKPYA